MTSAWARRAPVLMLLGSMVALPARAQQVVRELGVQLVGLASDPTVGVGGMYAALRPSSRARVAATVGVGAMGRETVGRGELVAHFLFNPFGRRGAGLYGGGGLAGALTDGRTRGYLVALVGLEARPGRGSGWAVEVGVGGGARLAIGYRWRWPPAS